LCEIGQKYEPNHFGKKLLQSTAEEVFFYTQLGSCTNISGFFVMV